MERLQPPGWAELICSLNPLQQAREYLKDRHERKKDHNWRSSSERDRAQISNQILKVKAAKEAFGAARELNELLIELNMTPEERRRIVGEQTSVQLLPNVDHKITAESDVRVAK